MDKQTKRHLERRGILPARGRAAKGLLGAEGGRAGFFRWFHEDVMGFDSLEYRRRFWREALSRGRTVGHMPRTALEFTDPRLHPYGEWLQNLVFLAAVMGAAAVAWWLARAVDAHVRRLRRPTYYGAERARRLALAAERRRIRRRRTTSPCPTPEELRAAFARARCSAADMIRFGSMLEDLECYVDNSVVWSETEGRIVGRHGGIRQWLRENAPDLYERYKTVMKYKALARRFRQAVGVADPVPASAVLPPQLPGKTDGEGMRTGDGTGIRRGGDKEGDSREHCSEQSRGRSEGSCAEEGEQEKAMAGARERAGVLLGRCEGTVASLAAQLERVLSPEYVGDGCDENTVRTEIARNEGRRQSSA